MSDNPSRAPIPTTPCPMCGGKQCGWTRERIAASQQPAMEGLRQRIEALPRWPVFGDDGDVPQYGRLVSLDDVIAALAATESGVLDEGVRKR